MGNEISQHELVWHDTSFWHVRYFSFSNLSSIISLPYILSVNVLMRQDTFSKKTEYMYIARYPACLEKYTKYTKIICGVKGFLMLKRLHAPLSLPISCFSLPPSLSDRTHTTRHCMYLQFSQDRKSDARNVPTSSTSCQVVSIFPYRKCGVHFKRRLHEYPYHGNACNVSVVFSCPPMFAQKRF